MADNAKAETPTGEPEFTSDQYKRLQREVDRLKRRNSELAAQNADHTALPASFNLLMEQVQALSDAVAGSPLLGEDQQKALRSAKETVAGKKQRTDQVVKVHGDINRFLEEHDMDWDAPEMEGARKAWAGGDVDGAYRAVLASVTEKAKPGVDVEALIKKGVEEGVAAKWKELGKVDTKESTAPSPMSGTITEAEFKRMTPEQRGEAYRRMRSG